MYLLPVLVTPILSRLYSLEAFGEWGVFSSFISIISVGLFASFDNAIVKAKTTEVKSLIILCLIVAAAVISLTFFVFMIGKAWNISVFVQFPSVLLFILYLIFYVIYTIAYNLGNRNEQYNTLSASCLIQGGGQAALRIAFGLAALTFINGLILGTVAAQAMVAAFLAFAIWKSKHGVLSYPTGSSLRQTWINYKKFPLFDAPSTILAFAAFNLPVIILAAFFDKNTIGCFSIVLQFLLLPMSFVGSAIGKVYYQRICIDDHDNTIVTKNTKSVAQIMAVLSILPMLFLALGGDKLLILFLGSKWEYAGTISLCLSLWAFGTVLTQPLLPIFRRLDMQHTMLLFDMAYFVGASASIVIGCYNSDNLKIILIIYSVVCVCIKLLLFKKILSLAKLSLKPFVKAFPLWIFAIAILLYRLSTL